MTDRLTEAQIDEIDRASLTPHRQITLPTIQVRSMVDEIRELRDQVCLLQMKVDGSKAVVDAVVAAARDNVDTKLSTIQIPRENGPSFYLIEAIHMTKEVS